MVTATVRKASAAPKASATHTNGSTDTPPTTSQPSATNGGNRLAIELTELRPELEKVLPGHITVDKFLRVVMTAISQNPDLYHADRRSLFTSCVKCATDGLVPDGREAALVIFNTKVKRTENGRVVERYVSAVQYMPMVAGILKKVRQSGELKSLACNVVYEADEFNYWIDDAGEHILHKPNILAENRGALLAVYTIAKTNDDGIFTEVMTRGHIEKVRSISRAKDKGPWVEWYDEMARKACIRRLSKRLPMSTDLEEVVRRDDELYDVSRSARSQLAAHSGTAAAKAFLGISDAPTALPDDEAERVIEGATTSGPHASDTLESIKEAGDLPTLENAWDSIIAEYSGANLEIPLEVEAAYKTRRESLSEQQHTGE